MKHLSWGHMKTESFWLCRLPTVVGKTRLPFCLELIEESQDPDGTNLEDRWSHSKSRKYPSWELTVWPFPGKALLSRWFSFFSPMDSYPSWLGRRRPKHCSQHSSMTAWFDCTNFKCSTEGQHKVDPMLVTLVWFSIFMTAISKKIHKITHLIGYCCCPRTAANLQIASSPVVTLQKAHVSNSDPLKDNTCVMKVSKNPMKSFPKHLSPKTCCFCIFQVSPLLSFQESPGNVIRLCHNT